MVEVVVVVVVGAGVVVVDGLVGGVAVVRVVVVDKVGRVLIVGGSALFACPLTDGCFKIGPGRWISSSEKENTIFGLLFNNNSVFLYFNMCIVLKKTSKQTIIMFVVAITYHFHHPPNRRRWSIQTEVELASYTSC